jgi:ribosome recycling factor
MRRLTSDVIQGLRGLASKRPSAGSPASDALQARYSLALDALQRELGKLRVAGRASPGLLDHILVPLGGATPAQPLPSLASVSVLDAATLRLNLYDPSTAPQLEAALRASPLKLSPRASETGGGGASVLLVSVPPPSAETRSRLLKLVKEAGEAAKASGRRARQEALEALKGTVEAGGKDELKKAEKALQAAADAFSKAVESAVKAKENEAA